MAEALPDAGIPTPASFDGLTPALPQSQPLPDHPTSFLLSDLRTGSKRKRDSSSLSTPVSFVNDHSAARLRVSSEIEACFGDSGARVSEEVCVDCVLDCDVVDCPASCEEKCTEHCVVVPCNDKNACIDACTDACIEEACPAEPCTGGVDCIASLDDTLQLLCCTDLHDYVPTDVNAASCQLNWDCTLDAFNQTNFPGFSQISESSQQQITSLSTIPPEISGIPSNASTPHISFSDDSASGKGSSLATPSQTELSTAAAAIVVQSLSQQQPTLNEEFACRWLSCSASFGTLNELVGHVNLTHLRPSAVASPPRPAKKLCLDSMAPGMQEMFPLSCHWDDCHIYPDSSLLTGPSSGLQPEIAFDLLSTHFIHDHLGLTIPPQAVPQLFHQDAAFSSTSFNSISTRASEQATQVNNIISLEPTDIPASGNNSQLGKALAPAEPSYATPELSPSPSNADTSQSSTPHNCATSSHICHWHNCNLSFPTCASLTSHLASAHVGSGKGRYDCFWGECGRSGEQGFTSKQKIMRHLQAHTGHRPYMCKECGQWFSEAATLAQHMRRHTQEKPFVCDFPGCGKAFAITGALTIHKRTHNGERPFQCPHCDRAFAESSNLSKHLRTHTGDRPYRCNEPGCGKAFARPDQLQRHGNVHLKKKAAAAAAAGGAGAGEVVASAGTPAVATVKSPA